jgi:hypothetical protein
MSAHNAKPDRSERLARVILALQRASWWTSLELQRATDSCNLTADISECRAAGYGILCKFVETLPSGRRVSRYRLVSTPEARK